MAGMRLYGGVLGRGDLERVERMAARKNADREQRPRRRGMPSFVRACAWLCWLD